MLVFECCGRMWAFFLSSLACQELPRPFSLSPSIGQGFCLRHSCAHWGQPFPEQVCGCSTHGSWVVLWTHCQLARLPSYFIIFSGLAQREPITPPEHLMPWWIPLCHLCLFAMPLSTPLPLTSWVLGPRTWSLCDLSFLTTAVSLDAGSLPSQTDPLLLIFSPFLADLFACCLALRTYDRHYKMGTCGLDALCSTYTLRLAFKI